MAPRKGNRRIDAAIDRFREMGYRVSDVRRAVAALLKVYGGPAAWPFLEEGCYYVVQKELFRMEDEKKQLIESHHQEEEELQPSQQPEPLEMIVPGDIRYEQMEEVENKDVNVEDDVSIEPLGHEHQAPIPIIMGSDAIRSPCYGWISESEDEDENEGDDPSPGGSFIGNREEPK